MIGADADDLTCRECFILPLGGTRAPAVLVFFISVAMSPATQKSPSMAVASPKKPWPLAATGIICVLVALTLEAVGVATKEWVASGSVRYGLWQYCVSGSCSGHPDSVLTEGFQATRALSILGVLLTAMSLSVGLVIICFKERVVALTAGILALMAVASVVSGFIIFLVDSGSNDFGYSFYVITAASALALVGGICFIVTFVLGRKKPLK